MSDTRLYLLTGGASNCWGGHCPAVYKSNDGRIFLQGKLASEEIRQHVTLAENEALIEVDLNLIKSITQSGIE